jgi:hypothetical protein
MLQWLLQTEGVACEPQTRETISLELHRNSELENLKVVELGDPASDGDGMEVKRRAMCAKCAIMENLCS